MSDNSDIIPPASSPWMATDYAVARAIRVLETVTVSAHSTGKVLTISRQGVETVEVNLSNEAAAHVGRLLTGSPG